MARNRGNHAAAPPLEDCTAWNAQCQQWIEGKPEPEIERRIAAILKQERAARWWHGAPPLLILPGMRGDASPAFWAFWTEWTSARAASVARADGGFGGRICGRRRKRRRGAGIAFARACLG